MWVIHSLNIPIDRPVPATIFFRYNRSYARSISVNNTPRRPFRDERGRTDSAAAPPTFIPDRKWTQVSNYDRPYRHHIFHDRFCAAKHPAASSEPGLTSPRTSSTQNKKTLNSNMKNSNQIIFNPFGDHASLFLRCFVSLFQKHGVTSLILNTILIYNILGLFYFFRTARTAHIKREYTPHIVTKQHERLSRVQECSSTTWWCNIWHGMFRCCKERKKKKKRDTIWFNYCFRVHLPSMV